MRGVLTVCVAMVAFAALAKPSLGCTIIYRSVEVGNSFRVRALDHGHPVSSLVVTLTAGGVERRRAITNRSGVARFTDVPEGAYHVHPDHPAAGLSQAALTVSSGRTREIEVPIHWPPQEPIQTRALNGTVRALTGDSTPHPILAMELLEGKTGRVLHKTQPDSQGAFAFPLVEAGLYFVRIQPSGAQAEGFVPLVFRPEDDASPLRIEVGWTSCGMYSLNQAECPRAVLQMARLSGRVLDASGAVIADASVLIIDDGGNAVIRARGEANGHFGPLELPAGRYHLFLFAPGFSSLEIQLSYDPKGDPRQLEAKLGLMGACSTAKLR